jgi:hypothetical protein
MMTRRLLPLAAILAVASGCMHSATSNPAPLVASAPLPEPTTATPSADAIAVAVAPEAALPAQKTGDYVVYRFSGSYRKTPLTLTQRVIDVKGTIVVVEYTLKDAARKRTARVTLDKSPNAKREIVKIARVDGAKESPMTAAELDALMAETVLAADENESTLGTENVKMAVGGKSLDCTKTSYRVVVGKRKATMSTVTSAGFAWGDVGGEIRGDDGKLLYRVEVVEAGNDAARD